jgi:hypothetical protein
VSKNAAVSGATAPKPPTNICALTARFIVAHIVKEAKRSPSQVDLVGSLYRRDMTTIG